MIALICPNCGGPLPTDAPSRPKVVCAYCSVVVVPGPGDFKKAEGSVTKPPADDQTRRRHAFYEAVSAGIDASGDPRQVLKDALREHLGLESEADVVANVAVGLAAEFREDTGIDVSQNGPALQRLAEGYLRASDELAVGERAEINLPFLAADASGPKHFMRRFTIADIRALSLNLPAPSRQPPAAAAAAEPPKSKKWWWPF